MDKERGQTYRSYHPPPHQAHLKLIAASILGDGKYLSRKTVMPASGQVSCAAPGVSWASLAPLSRHLDPDRSQVTRLMSPVVTSPAVTQSLEQPAILAKQGRGILSRRMQNAVHYSKHL